MKTTEKQRESERGEREREMETTEREERERERWIRQRERGERWIRQKVLPQVLPWCSRGPPWRFRGAPDGAPVVLPH